MTVSISQLAGEAPLYISIQWGGTGLAVIYADRDITATGAIGRIINASVVNKVGKLGSSGVTKTIGVTLDDVDGSLKTIVDSTIIEGSPCTVGRYIVGGTDKVLFTGIISSDILWSEGERTLEFSIESGNQTGSSGMLGYAPEENAYVGFNNDAAGVNWPIVFGTALKVPAVRVEYQDELTLLLNYTNTDTTYDIDNGSQLPQGVSIDLTIGGILFDGIMSGDTFTVANKNKAKYSGLAFGARPSGDPDEDNPLVAWLPAGTESILGLYCIVNHTDGGWIVNQCIAQEDRKVYFTQVWGNYYLMDALQTISEAAKVPRTGWIETFRSINDRGTLVMEITRDGWTLKAGAPVIYDLGTAYEDKYVVNLYPSTTIHEVWGKRTYYGKEIWARIPSSYYVVNLSDSITTDPGAVVRTPTTITFETALSKIECENWKDEIYVTLTSTLSNVPKTIADWVTTNFTSYSFNALSDSPAVSMNFAYFQSADAIQFMEDIAFQSGSSLIISNNVVELRMLTQQPGTGSIGTVHTIGESDIRMKSLIMGFRPTEQLDTVNKSTFVTDYSGEDSANQEYTNDDNADDFGNQEATHDMFALTCLDAVKAVTDFWSYRRSNSWKYLKYDVFLKNMDIEIFDGITHNISPIIPAATLGVVESIEHNTDQDLLTIEVEVPIKAGSGVVDPSYWSIGSAICTPTVGSQVDYVVPLDDSCPVYITLGSSTRDRYSFVLDSFGPPAVMRGNAFTFLIEIHDNQGLIVNLSIVAQIKVYTSNPNDAVVVIDGASFVAGQYWGVETIAGSLFPGNLRIFCDAHDPRIAPTQLTPTAQVRL